MSSYKLNSETLNHPINVMNKIGMPPESLLFDTVLKGSCLRDRNKGNYWKGEGKRKS